MAMIKMTSVHPKQPKALFIVVCMLVSFTMLLQLPSASAFPKEYRLVNLLKEQTNWSRFAYTQYATDRSYLCNSVMIFEALHRLGTRADLVLMYPSKFLVSEDDSSLEARLLRFARDNYGVKLRPIEVLRKGGAGGKSCPCAVRLQIKNECSTMVNKLHEAPCFQSNRL